jgi:hypothetical protein
VELIGFWCIALIQNLTPDALLTAYPKHDDVMLWVMRSSFCGSPEVPFDCSKHRHVDDGTQSCTRICLAGLLTQWDLQPCMNIDEL